MDLSLQRTAPTPSRTYRHLKNEVRNKLSLYLKNDFVPNKISIDLHFVSCSVLSL